MKTTSLYPLNQALKWKYEKQNEIAHNSYRGVVGFSLVKLVNTNLLISID